MIVYSVILCFIDEDSFIVFDNIIFIYTIYN